MNKTKELKVAIAAVKKAGKQLLKQIDHGHSYELGEEYFTDNVRSLKADVDYLSDRIIKKILQEEFPKYNLLTEESGLIGMQENELTWVVDPLCGTIGYLRGIKTDFTVSIALLNGKEILLGIIYLPGTDEIFWAEKGNGAYLNGLKIKVSNTLTIKTAAISIEHNVFRRFKKSTSLINLARDIRRIWFWESASKAYAYLACGKIDAHLTMHQPLYDFAAGKILVEEAGGKLSDFSGGSLKYKLDNIRRNDIIASNGQIHSQLLAYLT